MNEWILYTWWLEEIMRRALASGLLVFGIVFLAGMLLGWAYGLMIGFMIMLLVNLAGRKSE